MLLAILLAIIRGPRFVLAWVRLRTPHACARKALRRDRRPVVDATAAAHYATEQARTTQNHGDLTEMTSQSKQDERIAKMTFASVYPLYVNKVVKKGRSEQELQEVIAWLTGFTKAQIKKHITKKSTIEAFFGEADLNPNASY
jgi:hypothetical protein